MGYYADSVVIDNSKSGFRNDLDRHWNIPAHAWSDYTDYLDTFAARLQGVVIEHTDAFYLFEKWKHKPYLWYLDPPYVQSTRTRANSHSYSTELTDEDHERLVKTILELSGMVALSGYDNELYRPLEQNGWLKVQKLFKNITFQAGTRMECLWLNPLIQKENLCHKDLFEIDGLK